MTDGSSLSPPTFRQDLDLAASELRDGSRRLQTASLTARRQLVEACISTVAGTVRPWVAAACKAKRISLDQPTAAEEILGGPGTLLRYLQLLSQTIRDIEQYGSPRLPGKSRVNSLEQACVPILPVRRIYDQIIFKGLNAEVWLQPDGHGQPQFSEMGGDSSKGKMGVAGVLGAGNVSVIPATDMLYEVFHNGNAVLLKLNPVNEYLEPIFSEAFGPLIEANLLRMVLGGTDVGKALVQHPEIDSLHITGSHYTHDAIVWGADPSDREERKNAGTPLINKPITSELGNVTPWIIVPGDYSQKQLRSQAEHIAASIANNASFNCLSTKMIVTCKSWPQRAEFLGMVERLLSDLEPRFAYYPGAKTRFEEATGQPAPESVDESLPWTLLRDTTPDQSPHLFETESFVCVCGETAIEAPSASRFLEMAVDLVNERVFGTLCVSITVSNQFRREQLHALEKAIARLRYGSVCINQWSGVVYGMMTPPWGGHSSATLESPQSGLGHVHNTFCLTNFDKSVLWGPLCNFPKPVWFPSHRRAREVGWAMCRLYENPSLKNLVAIFYPVLRG